MYRVLIVDDEEPVLESFSLIVNRDSEDFELCGTARSGYEAIELCDQVHPDLVFMDIQMPGIDGIETIRQIRQHYPGIVFVLATAYERFDIAQQAIRMGIFSYLVKPVSRRAFLEELDKVRQMLDKRRESRSRSLSLVRRDSEEEKRKVQRCLLKLSRGILEKEEWEAFASAGGFQTGRAAFYVVGITDQEKRETLKNRLNYRYRCFSANLGRRQLLLFPEEQDLTGVYQSIRDALEEISEGVVVVGGGGVYSFRELSHSYQEALEPFHSEDSARVWELEQLNLLQGCLKRGDQSAFSEYYRHYNHHLLGHYDFPVALGKLIEAYTLFRVTLDWYGSPGELPEDFSAVEEIAVLETVKDWEQWCALGLNRVLAGMSEGETEELPSPLRKALDYIHEHFPEPIYLGSTAEACGISTGYLSHLFSEHMDTTFVNYLNRYRVDRAEGLLKEKRFSVKEVAFRTGYQDPNYFSRIFRKFKNQSPSEV